jgi:hypothetical protein
MAGASELCFLELQKLVRVLTLRRRKKGGQKNNIGADTQAIGIVIGKKE